MARLLVLDIDGTLLDPSDIVTSTVREAIAEARARGVEVALATGRRVRSTRPVVEDLGIYLPLVVYNGALVWSTEEDRPLHETPFTRDVLEKVIAAAREAGLPPVLLQGPQAGERIILPDDLPPESEAAVAGYVGPRVQETIRLPWSALPEQQHVLTVDLFSSDERLRPVTTELANQLGIPAYHHGPWGPANLWAANLHMPGVSKASGVAKLAADLGLTLADVVAVGDGDNDLPLLEAAGLGVAMGNAPEHVQARADVVVRGHDEDGVAEAIERFVLARLDGREPRRS